MLSKTELEKLFKDFAALHVVVVGDVMLDNYWMGQVERISPEAPVPVLNLQKKESRLGGAANVALNAKALGAKVTLASVIGADEEGQHLRELCLQNDIQTDLLLDSSSRPTTSKTRVMARQHQMLRLDQESTQELSTADEHPFIDRVLKFLQKEKPQVLIFEDYNKGVLKENVIERIATHCRNLNILTAVDPKLKNFLAYRQVNIFKPNLKEVREGLSMPVERIDLPTLEQVNTALQNQLHNEVTLITLSEHGVYFSARGASGMLPSHLRNIADVSGAGDTVIAVAALVYALTKDAELMAQLSNLAGGLVCESVGVVPIDKELLMEESKALSGG